MNFQSLFTKFLTLSLFVICFRAVAQPLTYAPLSTGFDRVPVSGAASSVAHTGTDIIYTAEGQHLQVMVWDNLSTSQSQLGWALDNVSINTISISSPISGASVSDPDVVMSYYSGSLYADVVYLVTPSGGTPRAYWDVYKWSKQLQSFSRIAGMPQALGMAGRTHASPNIDSNDAGTARMVWQESSIEQATVTVNSSLSYSNYTYSIPQVTFAQSYVLPARIDGVMACSTYRGVPVDSPAGGANPPVLFSQNLNPDVAVGPSGITSITYINSFADPFSLPVQAHVKLVVRQLIVDTNCGIGIVAETAWDESTGGASMGTPRIAASADPLFPQNVEVVLDWKQWDCVEGAGQRLYQEIRIFGRSAAGFRASPVTASIPFTAGVNSDAVAGPVVTCLRFNTTAGNYFHVSWTHAKLPNTATPSNSDGNDVWVRSYFENNTNVFAASIAYSRVNSDVSGNQQVPSIAGRYVQNVANGAARTAYFFFDEKNAQVAYKNSITLAGAGGGLARPANPAGSTSLPAPAEVQAGQGLIQAFPNPFSTKVDFALNLRPQEQLQQLVVTDMLGRVVDTIELPANQALGKILQWQPKQRLGEGSYLVKLTTNQRVETLIINRQ
jgi:uncharacterized cupredoxin-like copper-binding protein